jgi:hypothetical protein
MFLDYPRMNKESREKKTRFSCLLLRKYPTDNNIENNLRNYSQESLRLNYKT